MSASVHRLPGAPAELPRFGPAPLHRGERTTCPGCGQVRMVYPSGAVADGPVKGVLCPGLFSAWWRLMNYLWMITPRCMERRNHYHQQCKGCGARWVVGFLEEIE